MIWPNLSMPLMSSRESDIYLTTENAMNKKQLIGLGVPEDCVPQAIACVQVAARDKEIEKAKTLIPKLVQAPDLYLSDQYYANLRKP